MFLTELHLWRDRSTKRGNYKLDQDLVYTLDIVCIRVKKGFITDGASVPRLMRWWVSPFSGLYAAAAVIHDALYQSQLTTRAKADKVFLEAMLDSNVHWFKAYSMYYGVRSGGFVAWESKTEQSIKEARKIVLMEDITI